VQTSVAIVGAGPSGLATGAALARAGIPFVIYERNAGVGGMWDIDNPGTPVYASAHFISSRTLSSLEGHPFPDDYPDYPRHDQLLAYLRGFADDNDLGPHLRLGVEVQHAEPSDHGWRLELADGSSASHSHLVLCSGSQWSPNVPSYPGEWRGEAMHSRDYRDAAVFDGRRVLVVGAGNSGCDIACDAATRADVAAISMRRGYWVVPKHLLGKPTDVFAHTGPSLPGPLQQRMFERLLRLVVGDQTRYGLPAPDHRILATHPIVNSAILTHLSHGDLEVRPDIDRLDGDHVVFVDGRRELYDLIVWATGYRVRYPMVDRDRFSWRTDNDPDLFLNVFHRDRDDLFVVGLVETDAGAWPHISVQADLVAQTIRDQTDDPGQAAAFATLKTTHPDLLGGIDHVDSPRHDYYIQDEAYRHYSTSLRDVMRRGALADEGVPAGRSLAAQKLAAVRRLRRLVG
jgi:hypothetical protein